MANDLPNTNATIVRIWVRCTEMLPSNDRQVLVAKKTKNGLVTYGFGYYTESTGWVCQGSDNVIAWMNTPELPDGW